MNAVLLIDKPKDWTSQDVATKVRKTLKLDKVGHAGTLDPMATGVLVLLLNQATKLSDYLLMEDKEYECEIIIGKATTTEDTTGEVVETKVVKETLDVDLVLESLIGPLEQVPPMYSSIKYEGKKLYELARRGEVVERKSRNIEIFSIKRTSEVTYENGEAKFRFQTRVSKGTYIRTLCVEIGRRLNFPALMGDLRRICSGNFRIEDAYTLEDVLAGRFQTISMVDAVLMNTVIEVSDEQAKNIKNGLKLKLEATDKEVMLTKNNELLAIYEQDELPNIYKARRVWNY